jgi:hypothetical protein
MKHSFKKALLAGIVAAAFCSQAFSEEAVAPVAAPAPEVQKAPAEPQKQAKPVEKQDMTSKLPADLVREIDKSGAHNQVLDELLRKKALLQAENDLAKVELEQAKTKAEMRKVTNPEAAKDGAGAPGYGSQATIDPFTGLPLGATSNAISQMANQVLAQPKTDDMAELNKIFVTRVYGFGDKKTVTVYVENSVVQAQVGDDVYNGVKMVSATDTAATFEYKGKKRTVHLTTQDQAYSRSFEGAAASSGTLPRGLSSGGGSASVGRPAAMPAGMSMPNLQVPPPVQPSNFGLKGGTMMAPPGF